MRALVDELLRILPEAVEPTAPGADAAARVPQAAALRALLSCDAAEQDMHSCGHRSRTRAPRRDESMPRPCQQAGLRLQFGEAAPAAYVQALQADLRTIGYPRQGIDGVFGSGTQAAVRALQHDLLRNEGALVGGERAHQRARVAAQGQHVSPVVGIRLRQQRGVPQDGVRARHLALVARFDAREQAMEGQQPGTDLLLRVVRNDGESGDACSG